MNSLQRIGTTDSDNALFMFPHDGELVYFERIDYSTLRIHTVDCLEGAEQTVSKWDSFEDLPKSVRRALKRSNYRMRSTKATLEGVMHGD
jgi:hypothetical protein